MASASHSNLGSAIKNTFHHVCGQRNSDEIATTAVERERDYRHGAITEGSTSSSVAKALLVQSTIKLQAMRRKLSDPDAIRDFRPLGLAPTMYVTLVC